MTIDQQDRLVSALQLHWDERVIPPEIRALGEDLDVHGVFQKTFLGSEHGRRCLSILLVILHWADAEIVSEREKHMRNVAQKILALCGIASSREIIEVWLEAMRAPAILATEQRRAAEAAEQGDT